jgi:hypothetical protein
LQIRKVRADSRNSLITIMLGRLKMDVEECINVYLRISNDVFQPRRKNSWEFWGKAKDALKVKGRFSSEALKKKIQDIVVAAGEEAEAKLKIEAKPKPKCRV